MTVDVLMPVYGTPVGWLKEALDSIRGQTVKDFTLVIVDDNNPPGELRDMLYEQATCKCKTVIVRTEENRGVAAALNSGLKSCTGELVIRMDADDIARPELVEKHIKFFNRYPDYQICGVQINLFSASRSWNSDHPRVVTRKYAYISNGYWFVNHPGIAYRRDAVMNLGGYGETSANLAEDYALWVKFLCAGFNIYNMDDVLVNYRVHERLFSTSPDRKSKEWLDFLKQQKELLKW